MVSLLIALIVLVVLFWLISSYAPTEPPIRTILLIVLCIIAVAWLLNLAGFINVAGLRKL